VRQKTAREPDVYETSWKIEMMENPAVPAAILFDVDGTLIDTFDLYLEAYRRALAPFLKDLPDLTEFATRRPASERHFLTEWLDQERADECHARMCVEYEQLHGSLCGGAYEGVREMLAGLRSAGLPLGIVTGKGRRAWEITARAIDLGEFITVITEDDTELPKPHPGGLLAAVRALGVDPSATVYVGDSITDMVAGRGAGMRIGATLWPKETEQDRSSFLEQLREHGPDWVFERPADVTRAFAPWC
jgi:pyrophosphatase PpaX